MISTFSALDFRNLQLAAPLECSPHLNIICGANGQGKTNFIEGIHFLHHLSSFRTPRLERLLAFGRPSCWLQGTLAARGAAEPVRMQVFRQGRRVWRGGTPVQRLSDWIALHHVLVFHPGALHQRQRSPQERRALLDRFLCASSPAYVENLRRFRQVHEQKNQLLKRGQLGTHAEWNHLFARYGYAIVTARRELVLQVNAILPRIHGLCSPAAPQGRLQLQFSPSLQGMPQDWERQLAAVAAREAQAGYALYGPHRDDARLARVFALETLGPAAKARSGGGAAGGGADVGASGEAGAGGGAAGGPIGGRLSSGGADVGASGGAGRSGREEFREGTPGEGALRESAAGAGTLQGGGAAEGEIEPQGRAGTSPPPLPEEQFSQGEHRLAFLALQFALSALFSEHNPGEHAVLLLDDLFSELDAQACERVQARLAQLPNQIFITTTRKETHAFPPAARFFEVAAGRITPR